MRNIEGFDFNNSQVLGEAGELSPMPGEEAYELALVERNIADLEHRYMMAQSSYEEAEIRAEMASLRIRKDQLSKQ